MKTIELRNALATIARELPGQYSALEAVLRDARVAAQIDFARLVRAFEDAIVHQKQRALHPWRR